MASRRSSPVQIHTSHEKLILDIREDAATMSGMQKSIQAVLDDLVDQGLERGLQVAVYRHGELVVDAHAGTMDLAGRPKVTSDTLFPVFSTTKGIVATLIHLLVRRGKITYDSRIAEAWPEFAAQGKETITVRHALNHSSGIPLMPAPLTHAELCDWSTMCTAMTQLKPISAPGAEMIYHAITYGWILGELAHRVDGRTFPQLLHDEICQPLALTDSLFVGIPTDAESNVATLEANVDAAALTSLSDPQAIPSLVQPLHEWMNRPDAQRACIPASNGIMTARSIAKHYAALLPGGVDGIELLSPETTREAAQPQAYANQRAGDPPSTQGLGYSLGHSFSGKAFGHAGHGGSIGFADPENGFALGFTRNRLVNDDTFPRILSTLKTALAG